MTAQIPTCSGLGRLATQDDPKIIVLPFGELDITVRVTSDAKMLEVISVRIKTDFRTPEQKLQNSRYLDVDDYYKD